VRGVLEKAINMLAATYRTCVTAYLSTYNILYP